MFVLFCTYFERFINLFLLLLLIILNYYLGTNQANFGNIQTASEIVLVFFCSTLALLLNCLVCVPIEDFGPILSLQSQNQIDKNIFFKSPEIVSMMCQYHKHSNQKVAGLVNPVCSSLQAVFVHHNQANMAYLAQLQYFMIESVHVDFLVLIQLCF